MKEIWKDIEGYVGLYQVSNLGRVKSLERICWNGQGYYKLKERILKHHNDRLGYARVTLCKEGICIGCSINREVARAFIENKNNYPCTNHKDENPRNNHVDNLEWCTYKYNNNYGTARERSVQNTDYKAIGKAKEKPVAQYTLAGSLIKYWDRALDIQKVLGYENSAIAKCCNNRQASAHGFMWRYVKDRNIVNKIDPYVEWSNRVSVIQYGIDGKFIKKWKCVMDAEKTLQLCHNTIGHCLSGKSKTIGGYRWERAAM